MKQSDDDLKKKADEFLAKIGKSESEQNMLGKEILSESRKKEISDGIKWQIRMEYESVRKNEKILKMTHLPNPTTHKRKDKKSIDWGRYLLMGLLGVISLLFITYGLIFVIAIGIVFTIQNLLENKKY